MADTKEIKSYELDAVAASPKVAMSSVSSHSVELDESSGIDPEGVVASDDKQRSKFRLTMIIIALFLSLFIAALDATIVSTAVPTIAAELHSPAGYAWIGGAYLIGNSAGAPIWAKFSDIWGRKPILLAAVAVFMISSLICALAVDMEMLIVGRAMQGVAGGGLIMMVNIVISDLFSMRQRSLFLGFCEGIWAIAGALGPILGGVLTDLATWRWCWWINLPCCGVTFAVLFIYLDVHNPRTPLMAGVKAIDWAGSLSILGLTLMLLLGLDFGGETFPWSSPKVICLIVFGSLCSLLFIYAEKRLAKYPLIPLKLFSERSNVAALLASFFHGMTFIAGEYYMPLYFQSAKESSALRSGTLLVPLIVTTATFGIMTGVFIHATGRYRELIWIGSAFLTLGNGLYISLHADTPIAKVIGFQILAGIGSGLQFEPPLVALQAFSEQDDVATATSTFSFIRSMALAISVILGGVVFQNSMNAQQPHLRAAGLSPKLLKMLSGKEAAANVMITHTLQDPVQKHAVKTAFAWSVRNMWIMYTCLSFLGFVSGWFVKMKKLSKEHTETITGLKEKILHPQQSRRASEGSVPQIQG